MAKDRSQCSVSDMSILVFRACWWSGYPDNMVCLCNLPPSSCCRRKGVGSYVAMTAMTTVTESCLWS